MPKPSDFSEAEWIEAFAVSRSSLNEEGRSNIRVAVADHLGLTKSQVNNHLDRHPDLREKCKLAAGQYKGVQQLLKDQGVDPDSVIATQMTVNRWGDPNDPNTQLKVRVVPRWTAVMPARSDGWKRPKPAKSQKKGATIAVFADHHCPHVHPELHAQACQWLRDHQPDEIVVAGDLLDYDAVSRHRPNVKWSATMQETLNSGYDVLRGYLDADPGAHCTMIAGNHEDRLQNAVLDNLKAAFGVTRASRDPDEQDHAVLSLPHLLRLDELGIEFVGGVEPYSQYHHKLSESMAVRHGHLARKGAGATVLETIKHLRYSCIIGHVHRLAVVHLTVHNIDGHLSTLVGAECGTMAKIQGGLGYAVDPDWQQGFVVVTVWPDGSATAVPVPFINGQLLY